MGNQSPEKLNGKPEFLASHGELRGGDGVDHFSSLVWNRGFPWGTQSPAIHRGMERVEKGSETHRHHRHPGQETSVQVFHENYCLCPTDLTG